MSQDKQPNALYLLSAVQMWEYFSFYGMRVLLVLYMASQLHFSDAHALGVFAVYTGLVELGGLVGGIVADRFLGLRRAISLGGWLIALGHVVMTFQSVESSLFLGLGLIVAGSSLFSTNISALLGMFYRENDVRREKGFTLFYIGINFGALLASLLCGAVGEYYGWHYGFGLAALGMILGNVALYAFGSVLEGNGNPPEKAERGKQSLVFGVIVLSAAALAYAMTHAELLLYMLPWVAIACAGYVVHRMVKSQQTTFRSALILCTYLGALAVFYAAEEQVGSTLMLFSERHATDVLLGFPFPSSYLFALNPMTILLVGPFVTYLGKGGGTIKGYPVKMIISFGVAAAAFALFGAAASTATDAAPVSIGIFVAGIIAISIAELFVGPAVYSYCSEAAPEGQRGSVMGLVPLGFALSSFLGGHISQTMAVEVGVKGSLSIYGSGFLLTSGILAVSAILLFVIFWAVRDRGWKGMVGERT